MSRTARVPGEESGELIVFGLFLMGSMPSKSRVPKRDVWGSIPPGTTRIADGTPIVLSSLTEEET